MLPGAGGLVRALLVAVGLVQPGATLRGRGSRRFLFFAAVKTSFAEGNGVISVAPKETGAGRGEGWEVTRTNRFGCR